MNQHIFNIPYLYNPGILTGRLPDDLLAKVKSVVTHPDARTQDKDYSNYLIGNISGEYRTPEIPELIHYIHDMYFAWRDVYKTPDVPYTIDQMWTNYMQKGDYNPTHNHSGELAVFVIWITIPYDIKEEIEYCKKKHPNKEPTNSCFEFIYTCYDGRMRANTIHVDRSMEGMITMFPSTIYHTVYPFFTSDKERISIAGNIRRLDTMRK